MAKFGLVGLTVQGSSVSLPSGSASFAAIDTGTTLVAGPSSMIKNVYAQIPGSQPGNGSWEGFWTYRTFITHRQRYIFSYASTACDTSVHIAMSFGGPSWPVSSADFQLTKIGPNQCVGAFFVFSGTTGNAPSWIIGDTFLVGNFSRAGSLVRISV